MDEWNFSDLITRHCKHATFVTESKTSPLYLFEIQNCHDQFRIQNYSFKKISKSQPRIRVLPSVVQLFMTVV